MNSQVIPAKGAILDPVEEGTSPDIRWQDAQIEGALTGEVLTMGQSNATRFSSCGRQEDGER